MSEPTFIRCLRMNFTTHGIMSSANTVPSTADCALLRGGGRERVLRCVEQLHAV